MREYTRQELAALASVITVAMSRSRKAMAAFRGGIESTGAPLWAGGSGTAVPSLFFRRGIMLVRQRRDIRKGQHMKESRILG